MALTYTPEAEMGSPVPSFELTCVTDGKRYSVHDFKNGNPLVVMFICNHCPYVKAIEERLITLGNDLQKLSVNLVAICSNDPSENSEDSFESLRARALEKKYPFKYLHDETQEVAHQFMAVCTPDFFVYDGDLKLSYRGRLDDSWKDATKVTKRELFTAVQRLLKKESLQERQIPSMGCNIKWK